LFFTLANKKQRYCALEFGCCNVESSLSLSEQDASCFAVLCSLRCPPIARLARQVIEIWKIVLSPEQKAQIAEDEKSFADKHKFAFVPGYARLHVDEKLHQQTEEQTTQVETTNNKDMLKRYDVNISSDMIDLVTALHCDEKQDRKHASAEFQVLFFVFLEKSL
jgi:hypothetical protein